MADSKSDSEQEDEKPIPNPEPVSCRVGCNPNAIRISNMPPTSTMDDLITLAKNCPGVTQLYMAKDKSTREFKGFSYIYFKERKQAEMAVKKLNGLHFNRMVLSAACATHAV